MAGGISINLGLRLQPGEGFSEDLLLGQANPLLLMKGVIAKKGGWDHVAQK